MLLMTLYETLEAQHVWKKILQCNTKSTFLIANFGSSFWSTNFYFGNYTFNSRSNLIDNFYKNLYIF